MFTFARTKWDKYLVPRIVSIRGTSLAEWERKRPLWMGDASRERVPPPGSRKRARTGNKEGSVSVVTEMGMEIAEEELGQEELRGSGMS